MSTIRAFLAMLTLVAVALLPGPSHALAGAVATATSRIQLHDARSAAHAHHAAPQPHAGVAQNAPRHDHRPCKTCSVACCAPAIAALVTPVVVAAGSFRLRPARPTQDRARTDAARSRALRPPTPNA